MNNNAEDRQTKYLSMNCTYQSSKKGPNINHPVDESRKIEKLKIEVIKTKTKKKNVLHSTISLLLLEVLTKLKLTVWL